MSRQLIIVSRQSMYKCHPFKIRNKQKKVATKIITIQAFFSPKILSFLGVWRLELSHTNKHYGNITTESQSCPFSARDCAQLGHKCFNNTGSFLQAVTGQGSTKCSLGLLSRIRLVWQDSLESERTRALFVLTSVSLLCD